MELIKYLGNWLDYQLKIRERKGYVLGVSGGVDSVTLAKLLSFKKIQYKAIHIIYTEDEKNDDIINYFREDKDLNIEIFEAKNLFSAFMKTVDKNILTGDSLNLMEANIKARIREALFYNYANIHQLLVIGTVNKVEFNLGYFVKNSSIGDILPFADLPKDEIRNLAKTLGVPNMIADRKASGCVNKKYAEDEWGIKEGILNSIIRNSINNVEPIEFKGYYSMYIKSQHKREYPPVFKWKEDYTID